MYICFCVVSGCIQILNFCEDADYLLSQSVASQNAVNEILRSVQEAQNETRKKYSCQACGSSYTHKRNWIRHMKFECGHKPQYACPYCSRKFTRNNTLLRHVKYLHDV